MRLFDLHCDTLYKATVENSSLNDNNNHISVDKALFLKKWIQLFAIWIPDALNKSSSKQLFLDAVEVFEKQRIFNDKIQMHLAVENASMLAGDLDNVQLLIDNNVKSVTLTWNAENELGGGANTSGIGLTDFGRAVIKELENNNIAVDVSHASDKLFYDVVDVATKPIIATHSNSRYITKVDRNLTDEQFRIISEMGGIVGLNFYRVFLNNNENLSTIDDLVRHAEYFLNLGGENTLALGTDFDGADMPDDILGIETIPAIYEVFCRYFGVNITKKIFFENANLYFSNFDNF